jgi:hypothetical protein
MKHSSRYSLTDPDVIAANQRGEITPEQRARLSSLRLDSLILPVIVLIIGLAFCIFGIAALVTLWPYLASEPAFVWIFFTLMSLVGSVASVLALLYIVRLILARREWLTERIEQAEGQITWSGQNYIAEVEGRRLKPAGRLNLLPGNYQLFYLPRAGWLLSAERLAAGEQQTSPDLRNILAHANDSSLEAIVDNRRGRLADDQVRPLLRLMLRHSLESLALIGIALIFAMRFVSEKYELVNPVIVRITLGAIGALALYALLRVVRIIADIRARQVIAVEGLVQKTFRMTRRWPVRTWYYYQINVLKFEVSRRSYNALIAGLAYRLYYVPRSKTMVGIEPLSSQDSAEQPTSIGQ